MKHLFVRALAGLMLLPLLAVPVAAQERCTRHVYNSSQYPFRVVVEYNTPPIRQPSEWTVQPYSTIEITYYAYLTLDVNISPERINIVYHPLGTNPDRAGELLSSSWGLTWSNRNVAGIGPDNCAYIDHDGSTAWANMVLNDPADGDIMILPH